MPFQSWPCLPDPRWGPVHAMSDFADPTFDHVSNNTHVNDDSILEIILDSIHSIQFNCCTASRSSLQTNVCKCVRVWGARPTLHLSKNSNHSRGWRIGNGTEIYKTVKGVDGIFRKNFCRFDYGKRPRYESSKSHTGALMKARPCGLFPCLLTRNRLFTGAGLIAPTRPAASGTLRRICSRATCGRGRVRIRTPG